MGYKKKKKALKLSGKLSKSSSSPIFLGGAGRSGTTLLRVIFDSHPNIACGPELKVTPLVAQMWYQFQTAFYPTLQQYHLSRSDINSMFRKMLLSLLENYRKAVGKQRVAEKSPNNVFFFQALSSLFPESPMIHVIRDGRDVVCSLLTMNWIDPSTGRPVDYTRDVGKAAHYWVSAVRAGREDQGNPMSKRKYMEVHYEDMVENPEATLRKVFDFIQEPWDPSVLNYHQQKRNLAGESSAHQVSQPIYRAAVQRWRRDLKPSDKEILKKVAGKLLIELGYAKNLDW